jgi:hypothetical protein
MKLLAASCVFVLIATQALAASGKQAAPAGSFSGAPAEFTKFSSAEIERGFLALAFGTDLLIGAQPKGVRRFNHPIRLHIAAGGSVARADDMKRIVVEYESKVPNLRLSVVPEAANADVVLRLIDEKDFAAALTAAFGAAITQRFVQKTDPQCMTSVKSQADGNIVQAVSFVIVDKGDAVFLDCAYHELLHAFGLSNHDQRNPWTTLNQKRMVGYLTVYDRALLTLLYDPRIHPGMTPSQVRRVLPGIVRELGLSTPQGQ